MTTTETERGATAYALAAAADRGRADSSLPAGTPDQRAKADRIPYTWTMFLDELANAVLDGRRVDVVCVVTHVGTIGTAYVLPYFARIAGDTRQAEIVRLGGWHSTLGDWQHRGNRSGYRRTGGGYNKADDTIRTALHAAGLTPAQVGEALRHVSIEGA